MPTLLALTLCISGCPFLDFLLFIYIGLGSGLGLRFINENFNMELVEVTGNKLELDCSVYSIAGTITVTWYDLL